LVLGLDRSWGRLVCNHAMTIVWIFALVFVIVVVSFLLSDFARRDGNPPSCH